MAGSGRSRASTSSWFVKARRAGENDPSPETWRAGGVSPTLNAGENHSDTRAVVLVGALTTRCGNSQDDQQTTQLVAFSHTAGIDAQPSEKVFPTVRRLSPLECERLQGFPDDWTDVPGATDSARYKQCGNAVTVAVFDWVLGRLVAADARLQGEVSP